MELTGFPLLTYSSESDATRQLRGKLPRTVLHTLPGFEKQEGSETVAKKIQYCKLVYMTNGY